MNAKNIGLFLPEALEIHLANAQQIEYLRKVVKGDQEIYNKTKQFRENINNVIVENHVQHMITFKVGYVFDGIQYVQISNDIDEVEKEEDGSEPSLVKEINILNSYFRNTDKQSKDAELQHEVYATGICPRIVLYGTEADKPFEIYNLDSTQAFVVYSSGVRGERLFSVRLYKKKDYEKNETKLFMEVVTKQRKFLYSIDYEDYQRYRIGKEFPIPKYIKPKDPIESANPLGEIPIFEYTFNKERQSLTELVLDAQDLLNRLTSSEIDDVEQFVQSFIALINVSMDEETWESVKSEGLFSFKSGEDGRKADIKVVASNLDYTGTKILFYRIYEIMLTNAGIPLLNTSGGGGDTGIARLTDNGWTMADTKARKDELGFKQSDKPLLEFVIKILKRKKLVEDISVTSVDIKFSRNKNDNIQTKVQSLQSLIATGVDPQVAFETINLFGDPTETYAKSLSFYGEDFYRSIGSPSNNAVSTSESTNEKQVDTTKDETEQKQQEQTELSDK